MPSKKSYHHGDLRAALIEAGLSVLRSDGLEALSLRRAAREAKVSATAPYRHFKDKHALLAAVSEHGFLELRRLIDAANEAQPGDLDAAGQAYLSFGQKEPALYALMFTKNMLCEGEVETSLKEAGEAAFVALVQTIEAGMSLGSIKATQSLELALAAWAMVHGVTMLLIDGILDDGPYSEIPPDKMLSLCQAHFRAGWRAQAN